MEQFFPAEQLHRNPTRVATLAAATKVDSNPGEPTS